MENPLSSLGFSSGFRKVFNQFRRPSTYYSYFRKWKFLFSAKARGFDFSSVNCLPWGWIFPFKNWLIKAVFYLNLHFLPKISLNTESCSPSFLSLFHIVCWMNLVLSCPEEGFIILHKIADPFSKDCFILLFFWHIKAASPQLISRWVVSTIRLC